MTGMNPKLSFNMSHNLHGILPSTHNLTVVFTHVELATSLHVSTDYCKAYFFFFSQVLNFL
jgi:hypothetical protein